jgi:hypothetical protein
VLLPGFDYGMSEWQHPQAHEITGGWSKERPPFSATTPSSTL